MHITDKYWARDQQAPHKMNLMGTIREEASPPVSSLLASYWANTKGWEWHIHIFNNVPDMQEHGLCRTEYETRTTIQFYLDLSF